MAKFFSFPRLVFWKTSRTGHPIAVTTAANSPRWQASCSDTAGLAERKGPLTAYWTRLGSSWGQMRAQSLLWISSTGACIINTSRPWKDHNLGERIGSLPFFGFLHKIHQTWCGQSWHDGNLWREKPNHKKYGSRVGRQSPEKDSLGAKWHIQRNDRKSTNESTENAATWKSIGEANFDTSPKRKGPGVSSRESPAARGKPRLAYRNLTNEPGKAPKKNGNRWAACLELNLLVPSKVPPDDLQPIAMGRHVVGRIRQVWLPRPERQARKKNCFHKGKQEERRVPGQAEHLIIPWVHRMRWRRT